MGKIIFISIVGLLLTQTTFGQIPAATLIKIVKAEDARNVDPLAVLFRSTNAAVRSRAALAAGRIGNDAALGALQTVLAKDVSADARATAAFAIGEIESIKRAYGLLDPLKTEKDVKVRARIIEAAGKMAAANPVNAITPALRRAILEALTNETDVDILRLTLTAALRARLSGAEPAFVKLLTHSDASLRAEAALLLSRLRSKAANAELRRMLTDDVDPMARANAARALGAAIDKVSISLLENTVSDDKDSRVRVSAIRALGNLKDAKAAVTLINHGNALIDHPAKTKLRRPKELTELLEIATVLGGIIAKTENEQAIAFLNKLRLADGYGSEETEIAVARIAPKTYLAGVKPFKFGYRDPNVAVAYGKGLAAITELKDNDKNAEAGRKLTSFIAGMATGTRPADQVKMLRALPDLIRSQAALQPDNLDELLRGQLLNKDIFIRTAAAELIGARPATKENLDALKQAAALAAVSDRFYNDAQLAIMDALSKLNRKESAGILLTALNSPDYIVRKKAFEFLKEIDTKEMPGIPSSIESAVSRKRNQVLPYSPIWGTRQGQVLNTTADYRRALARKNGSVKAVLKTEKGNFTIDFYPEDAPLTVDNFVKLARRGYFNGLEVHRVVANFVMQDGDPRGDGNGGPGYSIRCEINMLPYERGAVGMALSGKDTGGSQWFVTHSPQLFLDGGYTVFGRVDEAGMKVVDNIVRGDKILSVKIMENVLTQRSRRTPRRQG